MLSVAELAAHLRRITYKPGWKLSVREGGWEGTHFRLVATLPNSYGAGRITIGVDSMVPPMESVEQFERWIAWRLGRIEVHEMREFLKRDGEVIFDPHAPGAHEDPL